MVHVRENMEGPVWFWGYWEKGLGSTGDSPGRELDGVETKSAINTNKYDKLKQNKNRVEYNEKKSINYKINT